MNIKDIQTVLFKMAEKECTVPPLLWGQPGIAKTAIVEQIAKALGYNFYPLILSQIEAVDLLGLPFVEQEKDGEYVTDYRPQRWFKEALTEGKMILFLDELNRARQEVIKAAFTLVNERRLNGKKLPSSVMIVVACNPPDERNNVVDLDEALIDRFMHIRVNPSHNVWMEWAKETNNGKKANVHRDVINFIALQPDALFTTEKGDRGLPVKIKPTPRAWERASKIHELELDLPLEIECLSGIVGAEFAQAFRKSLSDKHKPFTPEEILNFTEDSETAKRLKQYSKSREENRMDLLKESIKNFETHMTKHHKEALKNADNVISFIRMLPDDLVIVAVASIHQMPSWAGKCLGDPELRKKMEIIKETIKAAEKANGNGRNK